MTMVYPSLRTHPAQDPCCPRLWDALREVTDPEIPVSLVDLGMIVDVCLRDGVARIKMTLTAMGCPATEYITDDIRARLLQEPDVREIEIEIVWDPVWTKARLSDDGVDAMRAWGISA